MQPRKHFPFRYIKLPKEFLKLPRSIKYSFIVFLIYYMGWGIVTAYEPIYIRKILGNYSGVGIAFASFHLLGVLFSLTLGILLDKLNKRKVLRFFLIFYLPFSYLFLTLRTLTQFLIFKAYHGIIARGLWVSAEAYVRKHTPKKKEVESIALFDLSTVIALIVGGFLGAYLIMEIGFNIFYAISFFAFLALLVSAKLPDREKTNFYINIFKGLKKELKDFKKNKKLQKLSLFLFVFAIVVGTMPMIFPLFLRHIGAALWQIGIIYAVYKLPLIFEGWFALIKKRLLLLRIALIVSVFIFLLMVFIKNLNIIFGISLLISLGFSAIAPIISGKLTKTMPPSKRGELSGLLAALRDLAFIISSVVAGLIADKFGINWVFFLNAILLLSLFILTFYFFKKEI